MLLKKIAKDNEIVLWSLYLDSEKANMKLQLISVKGITKTSKE